MSTPVLGFRDVSKVYPRAGGRARRVLDGVSLEVAAGGAVSLMGRSGSGKSTLLNLAAAIDLPTSGDVTVLGSSLRSMRERERTRLRRDAIGMVFQFFHLLPHLNVLENVMLPGFIAGAGRAARSRALDLLGRVGLQERAGEDVRVLSGGEAQRVAICRALLRRPRLLLADEPTGNLDDVTGRQVMDLLLEVTREERSTLIFVTHDPALAALAGERWHIHSGRVTPS